MRTVHLIAPGPLAGAERCVLAGTAAQAERGADVSLVVLLERRAPEHGHAFAAAARVPTMPLPVRGRLDPSALGRLREHLAARDPAILHAHGYKALFYGAAARGTVPLVAHHHGVTRHDRKVRLYEWLAKGLYAGDAVRRVVVVGEAGREELKRRGIEASKVEVITNALVDRGPLERVPRGAGEPLRALVLGRLSPEKGIDLLLEALSRVPGLALTVDIVGDGPERGRLEQRARSDGRVRLHGWHDDVRPFLATSDALLLPSLREGLPLALLEGIAAGLVVVASRVGSVVEVVEDGGHGLLVPAGDTAALASALERLVTGFESLRAATPEASERVRRRHGIEAWADATLALYRSAVTATAGRA